MEVSKPSEVNQLYKDSAEWYSKMMDREIQLPIYKRVLTQLNNLTSKISGPLIDTSCGSGHMLCYFHQTFDSVRELIGIDLSESMLTYARLNLNGIAQVEQGDMRDLSLFDGDSVAGLISFFALHHLNEKDIQLALTEWHRILKDDGCLLIGTWEGEGPIDYGDDSEIIAQRYTRSQIINWVTSADFKIKDCFVEAVDGMPMEAIYLIAIK